MRKNNRVVKEIGSEFWDVPISSKINNVFRDYFQWFISGRSALQSIIKDLKNCRSVAMPSWCCDSILQPFIKAGIRIVFYPVYWEDCLIQEYNFNCDALLVMDYFGYTGLNLDLHGYQGAVIRDITHSLFSTTYSDADYFFGSLRKWCGVWTGGYAWAKDGHKLLVCDSSINDYVAFRRNAMIKKSEYIGGKRTDKNYLEIYEQAEKYLETVGIASADERDIKLALKMDIEGVTKQRRANAEVLRTAFKDYLVFKDLNDSDCPMFVPIFVPNGKRDALRQYLVENDIYCPIHWSITNYHMLDKKSLSLYENTLSLVCDQRYSVKDMYQIVETINSFWKGMQQCSKYTQ